MKSLFILFLLAGTMAFVTEAKRPDFYAYNADLTPVSEWLITMEK